MTDEELSMEFVLNYPKIEKGELLTTKDLQNAYLAGLKASRPKWHKVADGELPSEEGGWVAIKMDSLAILIGVQSNGLIVKERR